MIIEAIKGIELRTNILKTNITVMNIFTLEYEEILGIPERWGWRLIKFTGSRASDLSKFQSYQLFEKLAST